MLTALTLLSFTCSEPRQGAAVPFALLRCSEVVELGQASAVCDGDAIRVSVEVRSGDARLRRSAAPTQLWFEFPARYQPFLALGRADAFATALLPVAMALGENLRCEDGLSQRLAFGLKQYQFILNNWFPDAYSIVSIDAPLVEILPALGSGPSGVGCFFSGGVDSFFTLFQHLGESEPLPAYRISHALYLQGFDIPLQDKETFSESSAAYRQLLDELGVELIVGRTNLRDFQQLLGLDWESCHGAMMLSVPLLLHPLFRVFFVASSHETYNDSFPWGTDPRLDHHLSLDDLQVVHDSAHVSRVDKVREIARHPWTYNSLRVCWEKPDGLVNCGRCRKCVRTMIALEIEGRLSRYSTFKTKLDRSLFRRAYSDLSKAEEVFAWQLLARAQERGRHDIASELRRTLKRRLVRQALRKLCG